MNHELPSTNKSILFKIANVLLIYEPLWGGIILAFAYFILLGIISSIPLYVVWICIGIGVIPFFIRRRFLGYWGIRNMFELPIALFLIGAFIGLMYSINYEVSLRAFQSCLLLILFYYMLVNTRHSILLVKIIIVLTCIGCFIGPFFALAQGLPPAFNSEWIKTALSWIADHIPRLPKPSMHVNPFATWVNGLVMLPLIVVPIIICITIFSKKLVVKIIGTCFSLIFVCFLFSILGEGFFRLWAGISLGSRLDLWQSAFSVIKQHPFTGAGLGMPLILVDPVYHRPEGYTHIHNTYLELYANTGILGLIAGFIAAIIVIKYAYVILRKNQDNVNFGIIAGVFASIGTLVVFGMFSSVPFALLINGTTTYYYVMSPVPWILGAVLVMLAKVGVKHTKMIARE